MENRLFPRFNTEGLKAVVTLFQHEPKANLVLEGEVLDMSLSGIRIKLLNEIPQAIGEIKIKISLTSMRSKVPMQIHGVIRHHGYSSQYGVQFTLDSPAQDVNNLLFECIKVEA